MLLLLLPRLLREVLSPPLILAVLLRLLLPLLKLLVLLLLKEQPFLQVSLTMKRQRMRNQVIWWR